MGDYNIKSEEKEMQESMDQTISQEHSMTVERKSSLSTQTTGIEGMDVPASMISLPLIKLVQKSSSKTVLENGKDADPGTWYFTDSKETTEKLFIVVLRAKVVEKEFTDDQGVSKKVTQLFSLVMRPDDNKLYILILPITSFSNWGKLIAEMKFKQIKSTWEYQLIGTTSKKTNQKGSFFIAEFSLGKKLTENQKNEMSEMYGQYGGVLERRDVMENE